jgi:putative ABC transport system permease protein
MANREDGRSKPSFGERVYRRLLRLYPREFADEYGNEMATLYQDRARAESRLNLWFELLIDIVRTAPREQLSMLMQDVRHAFRVFRKTPVVTAAAILTLALGVGGNTAVFSVVHAVILRPLPYPNPDRLLEVFESNRTGTTWRVSALNYLSWAERAQSFEALAAFNGGSVTLTDHGDPERLSSSAITGSMFRVLGLAPIAGRPLRADDEQPGNNRVALLSEPLWRRSFGGDPSIVGQSITLNGERHLVIGVVPRAFRDVGRTQISSAGDSEIFVPLTIDPARENRGNHTLRVVGRLRPGVSIERARAEMHAIAAAMEQDFPGTNRGWGVHLEAIHESMFDAGVRPSLFVLLGAVGAFLLIACANVANLLLARGMSRQRELALRAALGASRGRVVRQLLTESVCLAMVSGTFGLLVSVIAVRGLRSLLPPTLPRVNEIGIDTTVLGFGLLVSALSGLFFGVVPAFRATRVDVLPALGQSGKGVLGASGAALRQGLVVAQMALATMLLVLAAVLIQGFLRLQHLPLGFEPEGVMTARISLPDAKYPDASRISTFYGRLLQSLEGVPGVHATGVGTSAPFTTGVRATASVRASTSTSASLDAPPMAVQHVVSADYFRAVGAPLLSGRSFGAQDGLGASLVAIVSESFARQAWPDRSPIGQTLEGNDRLHTVVGVIGDMRGSSGQGARGGGLEREPQAAIYFPAAQLPERAMTLVVRVSGEPSTIVPAIREAVRQIDPAQPIYQVRSIEEWLGDSAAQPRLTTMMAGAFALTALLLAAIGVYGVLAYSVGQRTQEIGVRMAMGAQRSQVLLLVLRGGMTSAAGGIALGLAGAFALTRVLANLLFEVPVRDPSTFAAVGSMLVLVALAACYVPAARATGIDPALALRTE